MSAMWSALALLNMQCLGSFVRFIEPVILFKVAEKVTHKYLELTEIVWWKAVLSKTHAAYVPSAYSYNYTIY
jgi:hypothetical protein